MADTSSRTSRTPAAIDPAKSKPDGPAGVPMLPLSELEFVGCVSFPMTRDEYDRYEERLEVWDAETETAWRVEALTGPAHAGAVGTLAALVERIASVRGSGIGCYGSTDLQVRDARGEPRRVMRADDIVYLYPSRVNLVDVMVVGESAFPDVVLEVDHTTDVRRGKLPLYESWGFPEVWVEVPEVPDPRALGRPPGLCAGLTIYLLEGDSYRESPMSRTFPGWHAAAVHTALNEIGPSVRTCTELERVGRTLGERDGTGPDDDPMLRSLRAEARAEGFAKGFLKSRAEAEAKIFADGMREVLRLRGIPCSENLSAGILHGLPASVIAAAALACDSQRDFYARLRAHVESD